MHMKLTQLHFTIKMLNFLAMPHILDTILGRTLYILHSLPFSLIIPSCPLTIPDHMDCSLPRVVKSSEIYLDINQLISTAL